MTVIFDEAASMRIERAARCLEYQDLQTTEELAAFENEYNWDDGGEPMLWVVEHPLCDLGTAISIFWRSGAEDLFQQYASLEDVDESNYLAYKIADTVEKRFVSRGFHSSRFSYNRIDDLGDVFSDEAFEKRLLKLKKLGMDTDRLIQRRKNPKRQILEEMKDTAQGERFQYKMKLPDEADSVECE